MAFNYSPKIVRDSSLVLCLDAANPNSFVSGSTIWRDVSKGGNNGTLNGGAGFNSNNGGNITLDGVDEYAIGSGVNLITQGTLIAWFKTSSSQNNKYIIGMPWVSAGSNGFELALTTTTFRGSIVTTTTGYIEINHTIPYNNNIWHMGALTYDSTKSILYYDGIATSAGTNQTGTLRQTANGEYNIGRFGSFGGYYTGNIANVQIYNRALSATEVLQNYNALKGRYNLR